VLLIHPDEDVTVYFHGVQAYKRAGFPTGYEERVPDPDALAALRPDGDNVLAIHCRQTQGGQFIDAGLVRLVLPEAKPAP